MEERFQIWIFSLPDGSERMILVPSKWSEIVQDEADELLREFTAHSIKQAREEFLQWRKTHWDDFAIEE